MDLSGPSYPADESKKRADQLDYSFIRTALFDTFLKSALPISLNLELNGRAENRRYIGIGVLCPERGLYHYDYPAYQ